MNLTLEQYEKLIPRCELEHGGARMIFSTPNTGTRWRVETISTKEPWTLDWIAEFKPNDILVDVGANVGMYTIWAAATRGARVCGSSPSNPRRRTMHCSIATSCSMAFGMRSKPIAWVFPTRTA